MIPLKLQIKNFLSYGSEIQTIEFGQYPLICLSGKNGHGKSALLDAITWALWGQARKLSGIAKADQGLLRLGQTQMMVCLDFQCAGQQYRVKREYMQTYGKPIASLDFALLDSTHDKFIPLTDKTIRETQHKIEQTLHLSYDAFINSAFLRQGQSNEFSKKSPKERKEVLGSILGLDRYEAMRRLASERIKQSNTYKLHLTTLNQKLEQELAQKEIIATSLESALQALKVIDEKEKNLAIEQSSLDQKTAHLTEKKQEIALKEFAHQQLMQEQQNLLLALNEHRAQWRTTHRWRLANTDFHQLELQKKVLVDEIKQHQQILQDQLSLKQELLTRKEHASRLNQEFMEKKLHEINTKKIAIERLRAEKSHLEHMLAQSTLAHSNTDKAIATTIEEIARYSKDIPDSIIDLTSIEKQLEKRKEHYQRWITQANMMSAQLNALQQKNKLVHDEEAPSCPLCEQNLSASRKRFLKNKFEEEISFLKSRFTRLSSLIKRLKEVLLEQYKQFESLKKNHNDHQLSALKIEELGKTLSGYQNQAVELKSSANKYQELLSILQATIDKEILALAALENQSKHELLSNESYQAATQTITTIEKALATHSYNSASHEKAMLDLAALEKKLEVYQTMQNQIVLQNQRAQTIATVCSHLKKNKKEFIAIMQALSVKPELEAEEKRLESHKNLLTESFLCLAKERESLLQEKGSLENQKKKIHALEQEYENQKKELLQCQASIDDYQAIAQATGKDGIQALLIEDAIPEIEQEANELLAKLTDNQTQLFIESLRDLKKGGTKETLDIKISDAVGIRPYELFSGGEAFRIDFALRIAISKLLARRAGTSLQTLIIDEGFGSQDEEGLSNIMDSLYKIQDDFAKIIIVSHLTAMKNQFPVHFVIEKAPNGSIVHVMEQG